MLLGLHQKLADKEEPTPEKSIKELENSRNKKNNESKKSSN